MKIVSKFKILLAQKEIAENRRISLRDVVRDTGVSISTVTGLANNSLKELPVQGLTAICQYLNCQVGDLLQIEEAIPKNKPVLVGTGVR